MKRPIAIIVLVVGIVALAAGLWVTVSGSAVDRDIPTTSIAHETGLAFIAPAPGDRHWAGHGDSSDAPSASNLRLFENDRELGPPHSLHADIRAQGHGRFSNWGTTVYLSSTDGTDPLQNGRTYHVKYTAYPASGLPKLLTMIALFGGAVLSIAALIVLLAGQRLAGAMKPASGPAA